MLDFSQFLAGPMAAMRLGDRGARVIKIERPQGGDIGRRLAFAGAVEDGDTLSFHITNRNKESYAADLKSEDDRLGVRVTEERLRKRELEILKEARRWGLGRDLGPSATDMHLLAVLQHHRVPTRLIDVTANPMTALWFATEAHRPDRDGNVSRTPGVLFAIDVTKTDWYETFQHSEGQTYEHLTNPLAATYKHALEKSGSKCEMFRAFPALPDERMKAQEGFFLGRAVPRKHKAPGVMGLNPIGDIPGKEKLQNLLRTERGKGRPVSLSFCAIVIPAALKDKLRDPLKHTYNRRRRVLFPDVDGFREGLARKQLD